MTKRYLKIPILPILVLSILLSSRALIYAGSINITVTNVKTSSGVIRIALYDKKESFPKEGKEYKTANVLTNLPETKYTFYNISKGWYAIALYHDINNDGICNRNIINIPIEPFGFSKNVKVKLSAPKFDDCSFYVDDDVSLFIELHSKIKN